MSLGEIYIKYNTLAHTFIAVQTGPILEVFAEFGLIELGNDSR